MSFDLGDTGLFFDLGFGTGADYADVGADHAALARIELNPLAPPGLNIAELGALSGPGRVLGPWFNPVQRWRSDLEKWPTEPMPYGVLWFSSGISSLLLFLTSAR